MFCVSNKIRKSNAYVDKCLLLEKAELSDSFVQINTAFLHPFKKYLGGIIPVI